MSNHWLTDKQLNTIVEILKPYAHKIDFVKLFGSRATGNYQPNSDIDLVIYGNLTEQEQDRIFTLFQDSSLSLTVDIVIYHLINYQPLKIHTDEVSCLLFTQEDLLKIKDFSKTPLI
jgi:uncharacterized protein